MAAFMGTIRFVALLLASLLVFSTCWAVSYSHALAFNSTKRFLVRLPFANPNRAATSRNQSRVRAFGAMKKQGPE